MPEIEFEIVCEECGKPLDAEVRFNNLVIVLPCERCKETAYNEGIAAGKDDGYATGFEAGKEESQREGGS